MPLPIAPIATVAVRYAAVAAAGYMLARALPESPEDTRVEAAMDEMPDGLTLSGGGGTTRAGGRLRKTFRLGTQGFKIDASVLSRLTVGRV